MRVRITRSCLTRALYGLAWLVISMGVYESARADTITAQEPIEISAAGSLVWDQANKIYKAEGQARAVQGTTTLEADRLAARYDGTNDQRHQFHTLEAVGAVRLTNNSQKASGGRLIYTVSEQKALLSGEPLVLEDTETRVRAADRFEYWIKEGRLVAFGSVVVERGTDTLAGDQMTVWFTQDPATQKRTLARAEAVGNVVITTQQETARSDRAVYDRAANTAELIGNVVIARGPNTLKGARAEMDLATRTSRLMAAPGTAGGRVSGVFFPGSDKTPPGPRS